MVAGDTASRREIYEFGPFRVDPERAMLLRAGRPVPLTPKTFQILLVLVRRSQEVVTKDDLLKAVWPDTFVEEANLSRNIFMLRKALGETPQDHRFVVTVPGQGYRLVESVRIVAEEDASVTVTSRTRVDVQIRESRGWKWAVPAAAVTITMSAGVFFAFWHSTPRLTEKDTLILADFSNATGDPVFDGTLRQGLAVQLAQSPFLSFVPEGRVRRMLKLMGQPGDARLTPDVARDVCERTGAAAVLEGSITSIGTQYVIGLLARNCRTDDILDEEQTQVAKKEDVLTALSQSARQLRTRLGESLASVETHSTPLDEATTGSLEALRAYSLGWQIHAARGASAAMPLFRRATEIDPQFAMAHASLGRMYADVDQSDLAAASIERAWKLRDHLSERERFQLTATHQLLVKGNIEAALQICETWAQAYPRDPRPHTMLSGGVNKIAGRFERARNEARKAIELDPDFAMGYYSLGADSLYLGRVEDADNAINAAASRGLDIDEFVMLGYDIAFVKADNARAEREAARAKARPGGENWMSAREAFVEAYSGHLKAARNMSERAVAQAQQAGQQERASLWEAGAAVREALFGNKAAATERAVRALQLPAGREAQYGAALAIALAGDSSRAQAIADDLERRFPEDSSVRFSYLPSVRAVLALNRGVPERALELLEAAVPHELGIPPSSISGLFGALYPIYFRGQVYLAARRGAEAVAEFRKVLDHPTIVLFDPADALVRLQLARAYVVAGDRSKADSAYRDFLGLWKNADRDIPILAEARAEYANLK
jgi:DNA-binding winged helix-turn-helix (wHTH) protein/tetratricopeptide (TPR) repeat protein